MVTEERSAGLVPRASDVALVAEALVSLAVVSKDVPVEQPASAMAPRAPPVPAIKDLRVMVLVVALP